MKTITRTPISENAAYAPENQSIRANRSATQWLFNPYSIADTTNWAVTTGVGKLAVGGLTKVTNVTEVTTPNRTTKDDRGGVVFDSTFDAVISGKAGYAENERFALHIASEIENNFPRRVHRIRALEGIDDTKLVDLIVESLLGESMAVAEIEGEKDPVPVLTQMLEVVRHNLREIAKSNSPQKALLLQTGKEFESTIADNIKLAGEDLRVPVQDVAAKKRAGFDLNAKRNFLALGKPIPEVNLTTAGSVQAETKQVDERVINVLDKLNNFLDGVGAIQGEPDETTAHIVEEEDNPRVMANQTIATTQPTEVEMSFQSFPKVVETKALTNKQVEKAEEKEAKKAEKLAEEAEKEADTVSTTPVRCSATTADGEQCKNDALEGSDYCHIPAHKKQGK